MSQDEMLDVVDEADRVIGQLPRSALYRCKSRNFRVVNGFLRNSQGQVWIPRRTAQKRIFPLALDTSIGGHVEQGESYLQAFQRELKEELNLVLEDCIYRELGYLKPQESDLSAFMRVYEIQTDHTPEYNCQDFCEAFWLQPAEVLAWIDRGEPCKGDLPKLIRRFYSTGRDRVD